MDNATLARNFFGRWETSFAELCAGFHELMAPYCVLVQPGMPDCTGPDSIVGLMTKFRTQLGIETIRVELVRLVSSGNCVVSERIDYLRRADGHVLASVPVVGVMEFRDGKIFAWREYFDSKDLASLQP